jgi:hypothetical protein
MIWIGSGLDLDWNWIEIINMLIGSDLDWNNELEGYGSDLYWIWIGFGVDSDWNNEQAYAGQLRSFTHRRVLLVLHDRGIE